MKDVRTTTIDADVDNNDWRDKIAKIYLLKHKLKKENDKTS